MLPPCLGEGAARRPEYIGGFDSVSLNDQNGSQNEWGPQDDILRSLRKRVHFRLQRQQPLSTASRPEPGKGGLAGWRADRCDRSPVDSGAS